MTGVEPLNDHELAAMLAVAENSIAKNPTAVVMVSAGDVAALIARMRADIATARQQATESAHIACAYAVADAPKGQEGVWAAAAKHCQKHITERARDEQAEREAKGNG